MTDTVSPAALAGAAPAAANTTVAAAEIRSLRIGYNLPGCASLSGEHAAAQSGKCAGLEGGNPPGAKMETRGLRRLAVLVDADVDGALGKARLAIAEIINPLAAEVLVIAERGDDVPALEEALTPEFQRLGVGEAEVLYLLEDQPDAFALLLHCRLGHQHAAGEDIALDEVRVLPVAIEIALVDGDCLDRGRAARFEPVEQRLEIGRPVLLAHRFDHLDRADVVELPLRVAIILEMQGREIVEALPLHSLLGEFQLLAGEGDAIELGAIVLGDRFGKAAPA